MSASAVVTCDPAPLATDVTFAHARERRIGRFATHENELHIRFARSFALRTRRRRAQRCTFSRDRGSRVDMGKTSSEPRLRINTSTAGRGRRRDVACLTDMFALLACYKSANFDEGKCATARRALESCLEIKAAAPKNRNTINFHLNRLARLTKK